MNEMIERVAKAMFRALDADPRFIERADLTPGHPAWKQYCCQARAAITAMREPTEAMIDAWVSLYNTNPMHVDVMPGDYWRAMIDTALIDH